MITSRAAKKSPPWFVLVLAICISGDTAFPKLSFDVWQVDSAYATHDPIVADVDGDGLKDLVIPQYYRSTGRELHIYKQQANGKLSDSPVKVEIKTEAIAFALADVRESAGTEILWITADAIYSFSANTPSYVGNLEHLADWELFIRHPDSKELFFVDAIDLNNDGASDLILPGPGRYGLFFNGLGKGLSLVGTIDLPIASESDASPSRTFNRSVSSETISEVDERGELILRNLFVPQSQYQGMFSRVARHSLSTRTRSITYGSWHPGLVARDVNGDDLMDLIFVSADGLNIRHLRADATYAQSKTTDIVGGDDDVDDSYKLVGYEIPIPGIRVSSFDDVDGDGDLDMVSIGRGFSGSTIQLRINDNGQFNMEEPTQVFRVNGSIMDIEFTSVHSNEKLVMLVNTVTTPLRKILTEIELHRNLLLFEMSESGSGVFNRKPSLTSTQSINVDSLRNLMPSTLRFDLDLDGTNDILESISTGTIQARRIDASPQIEPQPFWQFTPQYAVFSVSVDNLNGDQLPDLILSHSTAMTYLVSRR